VVKIKDTRNTYSILVGKPVGTLQLGIPKRRWDDNILMFLRNVGSEDRNFLGCTA
jgi:hypothetical protein